MRPSGAASLSPAGAGLLFVVIAGRSPATNYSSGDVQNHGVPYYDVPFRVLSTN
jgi:hypothetical protein